MTRMIMRTTLMIRVVMRGASWAQTPSRTQAQPGPRDRHRPGRAWPAPPEPGAAHGKWGRLEAGRGNGGRQWLEAGRERVKMRATSSGTLKKALPSGTLKKAIPGFPNGGRQWLTAYGNKLRRPAPAGKTHRRFREDRKPVLLVP